MTKSFVMSASSLDGDAVKNAQGEKLGDVKDIMLNTQTNKVEYYVLSFGGVLGMGDKLFAIPPEAMSLNQEDHSFTLNVPKEKLENAEGFDKDNWPNFADPTFKRNVYSQYGYSDRYAA